MKNLIYFSAAFFAGMITSSAQSKKSNLPKVQSSLLWKISGNDLQSPSYVLGTIHLICHDDFLWTDQMKMAFENTRQVVFEMDMDDPSLQQEVNSGLMLPEGKSLKDLLNEDEYAQLARFSLDSLGIPLDGMQHIKPFALISLLSTKILNCKLPESYEDNISKMAITTGKEILGLETAEDQLSVLDGLNIDSSVNQLMDIVKNHDSLQIQYDDLLLAYKSQDLRALYQLIVSSPDLKNDLNSLLFDRNKKWIPKIEHMIHDQPTFIAVGAAHLWGKKGILNLLEEKGYQVEPLR